MNRRKVTDKGKLGPGASLYPWDAPMVSAITAPRSPSSYKRPNLPTLRHFRNSARPGVASVARPEKFLARLNAEGTRVVPAA
jgi:hypothetical protein